MGHVTLTTYRTRRSPSVISLLYNITFLCVFLNADKLVDLNFHKFPSFDFRVHWNAVNAELGKTNSENSDFCPT